MVGCVHNPTNGTEATAGDRRVIVEGVQRSTEGAAGPTNGRRLMFVGGQKSTNGAEVRRLVVGRVRVTTEGD